MSTAPTNMLDAVGRITAVPGILRVITEMTGLRLALVAEVTAETWTCAAVNDQLGFGLNVRDQLVLSTTLCMEVRDSQKPVMFGHASKDPVYCGHPTPKLYNLESYISVPIYTRDRQYFGNLCALDSEPRTVNGTTLAMFEVFAELVGLQLDAEAHHHSTAQALIAERAIAEKRERFIAVVGHDLRTPLSTISGGLELLGMANPDSPVVARMQRSTARMSGMVGDLLDLSRGRLAGGIELTVGDVDLTTLVSDVVDEFRLAHRGEIVLALEPSRPLRGDRARIAQALTNLLSNAVQHGTKGGTIDVATHWSDAGVELTVTNQGEIAPSRIPSLFDPFKQSSSGIARSGLGLGLYIVREIARAHGGDVSCESSGTGTTFRLTLPA